MQCRLRLFAVKHKDYGDLSYEQEGAYLASLEHKCHANDKREGWGALPMLCIYYRLSQHEKASSDECMPDSVRRGGLTMYVHPSKPGTASCSAICHDGKKSSESDMVYIIGQ